MGFSFTGNLFERVILGVSTFPAKLLQVFTRICNNEALYDLV
jgi:hypothetical protein